MSLVIRRLRSLLIALAVLVLSATVALAGRGVLSAGQQPTATTNEQGDQAGGSESPDPSESEAPESPEPSESDAPESPDSTAGDSANAAPGVHPDNHGKLVSEAAHAATPAGFANHGAYVRTIAQNNNGHAGAAKHTKKH